MKPTDVENLRIGQRVTMRYPSGILQEAVLVANDDSTLNFQFGEFLRDSIGPVFDIFLDEHGK
jgi:hypothetical protein